VRLQELLNIRLQQIIRHAELAAGIELFFGQEKAVLTIQIADGSGWLSQQMEGRRRVLR
jgi:hypothetical protein